MLAEFLNYKPLPTKISIWVLLKIKGALVDPQSYNPGHQEHHPQKQMRHPFCKHTYRNVVSSSGQYETRSCFETRLRFKQKWHGLGGHPPTNSDGDRIMLRALSIVILLWLSGGITQSMVLKSNALDNGESHGRSNGSWDYVGVVLL